MPGADSETPPGLNSPDRDASKRCWKMQLSRAERTTFASCSYATKAIILRAAWAIVLARYCNTADVSFGASVESPNSTRATEPLVLPIQLHLDPKQKVTDFLRDLRSSADGPNSNGEHVGMQTTGNSTTEEAQAGCQFSSLLIVQKSESSSTSCFTRTSYSRVVLLCDDVVIELYVDHALSLRIDDRITALFHHFNLVVQQLLSIEGTATQLCDVSLAGEWDLQRAMATNADTPETIDDCMHLIFARRAQQQPNSPAICAWDGKLTYGELDAAAERLARRLAGEVAADVYVHVCFEKSVWFFVSILAINKAGGAWIPLDPLHPAQRLQSLVDQTKAKLVLTSPANVDICKSLGLAVMEVTALLDKALADDGTGDGSSSVLPLQLPAACRVNSRNAAYVLFTSGSTGIPKGLVIEHGSLCTSQISLGKSLGLTSETRFLQFASYVFDSCIAEIIATLLVGGCVCVPSDEVRWTGIPDFIRDERINTALLTPSFIRTIKPADVPSLRLLITASEPAGDDMLNTWLGHVRLINAWGPAEICCIATVHEWHSASESPMTIGTPMGGSRSWIVEPENHERLTPIGCLGEVVVQGPTILREYLSNPEKTKQSIMTPVPSWMQRGCSDQRWNRCFRTGDLAFYDSEGHIQFVGRKDTQVKIRGQRVELEEVESRIRRILEPQDIRQVAVDVSKTETATTLVAFLCFNWNTKRASEDGHDNMHDLFLEMTEEMARMASDLASVLRVKLPSYMVPTMFVPCRYMPYTTKLDRKTLRRKTASLHRDSLARYSLRDSTRQAPETALETQMQQLWASVLKVPAESIGRSDSFLRIGGDSISAIRLISLARSKYGIALTMASIFEDDRLSHLAATANSALAAVGAPPQPFSLLPKDCTDEIVDQALRQCGSLEASALDDVYPCTPLQEGLMALAVTEPSSYLTTWVYKLSSQVDCTRFKNAWEQTVARCDSLRTRIILTDQGSFQVVLKDDVAWEACKSSGDRGVGSALEWALKETHKTKVSIGSRLWRYALTAGSNGESYFTLIGHHSVFDGWSINLIMQQLQCLYQGTTAPMLEPFSRFMQYFQRLNWEASERHWTAQLRDAHRTAFPPRRSGVPNTNGSSVLRTLTRSISLPPSTSSITKATVLRAAWAVVMARYCDTDDVCFAASVSGRQAPVPGLESECGPVVATVPVRLHINFQQRAIDFLQHVQAHASAMSPYEQFGLQNISKLSETAREACEFSHVLVIHPAEILDGLHAVDPMMSLVSQAGMKSASYEYFGYPLVVHAFLRDNDVEFSATYDVAWMEEAQITALHHHVDHVVQHLLEPGGKLLNDVCLTGSWDLQQATLWNQEGPRAINDCIHSMITKQAQDLPDAPAICAWDGELSYREFDSATDRLARYLVKNEGVAIEDLVHVCFEKSLWFYVAILAISKAGGAWVPVDPSHPIERQQEIARQTGAKLTLTSPTNARRCVGQTVVEVTAALDKTLADNESKTKSQCKLPLVKGHNAGYVLFTSGSTGTPKGLVIEHGSVCTNMVAIATRLGITSDVRMLQFASYAFDVFVFESICFLMSGACICVPSETARLTGLEGFINTAAVTWADLTPSFARTIDSSRVPGLKALVVGGEPAGQDTIRTWIGGGFRLINAYGPAETCVISACHEYVSVSDSSQTIGRPVGGSCWIVEPEDHERLAPIGCIGEIVVQGPLLLREYLADREKTQAAIKTVPAWMPRRTEAKYDRLYKTGDLAYYNPDGTIEFIGRKDLQLKIRGQRVESGEVEHHIQAALDDIEQVSVDIFRSETEATSLVAYICFSAETSLTERVSEHTVMQSNGLSRTNGTHDTDDLFMPLTDQLEKQVRSIVRELKRKLPSYMVPTMFIPCRYMPFITTTKLDRKKLRENTAKLNAESMARYSLVRSKEKQSPQTAEEMQLRQLWASVLKVPEETIGRDDSFLQVGGDSVTAIRLVLLARRQGMALTVPSIMQNGRLSQLAATRVTSSTSG